MPDLNVKAIKPEDGETAGESPSDELVKKAQEEVLAEDANGRIITLRKPGVLAQFRMVEMLGETAANQTYMSMVLPLIYVTAIDGEPVPAPSTKRELEALIQRLDEEGVGAVAVKVMETWGEVEPEAAKETIKK